MNSSGMVYRMSSVVHRMDKSDLAGFINDYLPLLGQLKSIGDISTSDPLIYNRLKNLSLKELQQIALNILERFEDADLRMIYRKYYVD